jgi:hypothetical protein
MFFYIFFPWRCAPLPGHGPSFRASRSDSLATSHSVELLWASDQSDAETLPDNTQHLQETDIHAPGGIRIGSPSKRTATEARLDRAAPGIGTFT